MSKEIAGWYFETYKLPIGTLIKFAEERNRYRVRASNVAFAICTKPMNALKTVLYTIIDWHEGVRGTEGVVFCLGAESDEDCRAMLDRLTNGETSVSHRNRIPLVVEEIKIP